jgi:transcription initiation factor TFIIB
MVMQNSFVCPVCKRDQGIITDLESGEIVCSECGIVIYDKIQESKQEWRASSPEEGKDRRRTGMPTSLATYDMGLYTVIGRTNRDASGHLLDASTRSTMARLRTWDLRTQPSTNRSLKAAFNQLNKLKHKLALSDAIVEKTAYIYRKAQERGLVQGRSVPASIAAAVYIACREAGAPRTLKEISLVSNIKRKEISRQYRLLVLELDIRIPSIDPAKCIARIANKISLSEKIRHRAMRIMDEATRSEISAGKNPMGLAASVLYLSSLADERNNNTISQTVFAQSAGVTEVTIRNVCKNLKSHLDLGPSL